MASTRPVFLILPGGSQNPTHYGYLAHLLQSAGYPTSSALFPSVGNPAKISVQDDMDFFRERLILPYLDEGHDVIVLMHSYSAVPGSAAARGLGKQERAAQGKKGGVIGQIFYAAMLQKGGDETDLFTAGGGSFPPFLKPDVCFYSSVCVALLISGTGRSKCDPMRRAYSSTVSRGTADRGKCCCCCHTDAGHDVILLSNA